MISIIDPETGKPISLAEYSRATGLSYGTLYNRLQSEMSDDLIGYEGSLKSIPACDHNGKEFTSLKEMAEYHKIPYLSLVTRLSRGWSIKKALTTPVHSYGRTDLKGSIVNLCELSKTCSIPRSTIYKRYHRGDDIFKSQRECVDHLGNVFKSKKEMLQHYHVSGTTFYKRLKTMTLEQALTTPVIVGGYRGKKKQ